MRLSRLGTSAVLCLAVLTALVSCSSSSDDDAGGILSTGSRAAAGNDDLADQGGDGTDPDGTSDQGAGKITYTGAQNGSVQFDSASCAVLDGEFSALIAPDQDGESTSKTTLTLNHGDGRWLASFAPDRTDVEHAYVRSNADGLTADGHGDGWTVTLSNTELGLVTNPGRLTLNGTITCTSLVGS